MKNYYNKYGLKIQILVIYMKNLQFFLFNSIFVIYGVTQQWYDVILSWLNYLLHKSIYINPFCHILSCDDLIVITIFTRLWSLQNAVQLYQRLLSLYRCYIFHYYLYYTNGLSDWFAIHQTDWNKRLNFRNSLLVFSARHT